MLSSPSKFDITTLQSLSALASCSDDYTRYSRSIDECNGGAPHGIGDLYKVLEAVNSISGVHEPTDSEASLVLDLVRAKCDVFTAQKALADCVIRENEVLASLLKVRAAATKRKIDETDIGLGCMRIIFKDHSWSHVPPNHPPRGQGQSSSRGMEVADDKRQEKNGGSIKLDAQASVMPPTEHSKTVDFGIKLASLMSAPRVSDVPMMDKLTDLKLNQLIVEEEEPTDADQPKALSHMLSRIFRTFTFEVPYVTELQALPKCHRESGIVQLPDLEEGGDRGGVSSASDSEESGGEDPSSQLEDTSLKPHTLEDIFSSFFNTTCGAVAKMRRKEIIKENIGACPVKDKEVSWKPDLALLDDVEAQWDTIKAVCELTSQLYTPTGMIGKTIDSKAYLLLRRQPWRQFVLLFSLTHEYREFVVFGNLECIGYNPSIGIFTKTLRPAQLENLIFRPSVDRQPSRAQVRSSMEGPEGTGPKMIINAPQAESDSEMGSDVEMSLSLEESLPQDPPQLEMPEDPLCRSFSDPIGRITVNDHTYNILEVIFSSQGLVGRGTICYLARRDDEEYIIKDHWVLGGKDAVLNEVRMLREMQGVRGVPELVEYWLVEIAPNEVDETMNYRYKVLGSIKGTSHMHVHLVLKPRTRPLHAFWTKLELVSALQDIVIVQRTAVEDHGVLHHDCSLNNTMIEDDGDGTNGLLINWEFAVHIDAGRKYTIGGTGTLPFMSHSLLWQLSEAVGDVATSARSWKAKLATSSLTKPPPLILHHYHDDLESLFYVFMGPLGVKCDLSADRSQEWLPHLWSADTFKAGNKLKKQFHPYFNTLIPLATQWYDLIRNKGPSSAVTFREVLDLLATHLAELPKDKPSPELLFAKKFIVALLKKRHASDLEGDDDRDRYINEPPNTERNIIHGQMGWTMEVAPQSKRSRTT
ncbi:hypothetical protein EDB19DRAFT_2029553 [Suillus lakei]|nr:hypothetical protein EDB19DRAFT_2029553 [Suillus lakei]